MADVSSAEETTRELQKEDEASYSVDRLEQDLKSLHGKWRRVENQIQERDRHIDRLTETVCEYQEQVRMLEADIERVREEKQGVETDLANRCESESQAETRIAELESESSDLAIQLQDLGGYIDGRKDDWREMRSRLESYEDTIRGMEKQLEDHDGIVAGKADENAVLAQRIMDLERELAELRGRHNEKKTHNAELQQALKDQSCELGAVNSRVIALQKTTEELNEQLAERQREIESMTESAGQHGSTMSRLEERLAEQKSTVAELRGELHEARENAADHEAVEALRLEAAEQRIQATELQAILAEVRAEKKALEIELEAQNELVGTLEQELERNRKKVDSLDICGTRLSAIANDIRDMDVRIDDEWLRSPSGSGDIVELVDDENAEVMLEPEEILEDTQVCEHRFIADDPDSDDPVSYDLDQRSMTVGRSRRSDIRINSKYISRTHATIRVVGDKVVVEDVGSTNGFRVNSRESKRCELQDGDTVQFGTSSFRYVRSVPG